MELTPFRIAVCTAIALLPCTTFGQQNCDTSAFTYNATTGEYYMPGGLSSATSSSQCACLQQQWNAITQQIQAEHQNCLNAHQGEPNNPNSGSYPGSECSIASCQSLHDALYTTMAPEEQAQLNACSASVGKFQAQQAAQLAAQQQQQAAAAAAQQKRADQLAIIKQRIAAIVNANQSSQEQLAILAQQLQSILVDPNGSSRGVSVQDFNHPETIPDSPGVTELDFNNNGSPHQNDGALANPDSNSLSSPAPNDANSANSQNLQNSPSGLSGSSGGGSVEANTTTISSSNGGTDSDVSATEAGSGQNWKAIGDFYSAVAATGREDVLPSVLPVASSVSDNVDIESANSAFEMAKSVSENYDLFVSAGKYVSDVNNGTASFPENAEALGKVGASALEGNPVAKYFFENSFNTAVSVESQTLATFDNAMQAMATNDTSYDATTDLNKIQYAFVSSIPGFAQMQRLANVITTGQNLLQVSSQTFYRWLYGSY
jgi:hypothetical protein